MPSALKLTFWASAGLLVYAQAGYPLALAALDRLRGPRPSPPSTGAPPTGPEPDVSLIVAAHDEETVIAAKVADARGQDWPPGRLEVIVCSDGSSDGTVAAARAAGADAVLDLPRGGKIAAQDAGVDRARGEIVAFSDANAAWEPDALARLVESFADPGVGYVCGQVRFLNEGGTNQEGLYWRYEMWTRALESRLASVTAGNGAIYATRREAYVRVDPIMGHDLTFPFTMVKRGWRAVYAPAARATEKMVPSIEGEFARKRRMMSHTWPIVVRGGMLDPRGYGPLYGFMIASHRVLRYLTPFLHLAALGANAALVALGARGAYVLALAAQAALLAGAIAGGARPGRAGGPPAGGSRRDGTPLPRRAALVARYYVVTTASVAAGLWDWLREGTAPGWDAAEGTR